MFELDNAALQAVILCHKTQTLILTDLVSFKYFLIIKYFSFAQNLHYRKSLR